MARCMFCERAVPQEGTQCPHCGAAQSKADPRGKGRESIYATVRPDDTSWHHEITSLVSQGRTIEAIKLYRDRTGSRLNEAKTAVEALARGELMAIRTAGVSPGTSAEADLLDRLRQGDKIGAIQLHRERSGAGLREASETVDRLAAQHGIAPRGAGCLGILAAAAIGTFGWWLGSRF